MSVPKLETKVVLVPKSYIFKILSGALETTSPCEGRQFHAVTRICTLCMEEHTKRTKSKASGAERKSFRELTMRIVVLQGPYDSQDEARRVSYGCTYMNSDYGTVHTSASLKAEELFDFIIQRATEKDSDEAYQHSPDLINAGFLCDLENHVEIIPGHPIYG